MGKFVNVPTPEYVATLEERDRLRAAWEQEQAKTRKLEAEQKALRVQINFWQSLGQSILGNAQRITRDMQQYLRDALAEEADKQTSP